MSVIFVGSGLGRPNYVFPSFGRSRSGRYVAINSFMILVQKPLPGYSDSPVIIFIPTVPAGLAVGR
ncbi:MAG: hypothetical protein HQK49_22210 [Oligoflexia bacterium]|nr:hypothetical protein [Oligoflexia bacterium]